MQSPIMLRFGHFSSLDLGERLPVSIFGIAATTIVPLALYAHKGVAPLFACVAASTVPYWIKNRDLISLRGILSLILVFLTMILVSSAWSLTPSNTFTTGLSLFPTLVGGYLVSYFACSASTEARDILRRFFVYGILVGLAIFIVDIGRSELIFYLGSNDDTSIANLISFWNSRKPSIGIAALVLWPWAYAAKRTLGWKWTVAIAATVSIVIFLSGSNAAILAILAGSAIGLIIWTFGKSIAKILPILFVAAVAVMPAAPGLLTDPTSPDARYNGFDPSAIHRILIWQTAAATIPDRPWLGHGFDSSRALPEATTRKQYIFLPATSRSWTIFSEGIPLHPHNLILQVWIELGFLGAILLATFLVTLSRTIVLFCSDKAGVAIGFSLLVSAATIASISFGAWQAWWLATLMLCAACFSIAAAGDSARNGKKAAE